MLSVKQTISIETLRQIGLVSSNTEKLFQNACSKLELQLVDYMTIRDIVQFCDAEIRDIPLHSLLLALFLSLDEGSLCLNLTHKKLTEYLNLFYDGDSSALSQNIDVLLQNPSMKSIFSENPDDYVPLIKQENFLYFQKYFHYERQLYRLLQTFLTYKETKKTSPTRIMNVINQVLLEQPIRINSKPMLFNNEQKLAIITALTTNFCIISGGPGTGKTSILINIIRSLIRLNDNNLRIALSAPTGRAAQRITDSIRNSLASIEPSISEGDIDFELLNTNAATLHKLLRYSPARNNFVYNQFNKLPIDVLVIDEVSMVDVIMMNHLLDALEHNTIIVMLGDKDQLPSVDAGAVLADLMPRSEPDFSYNMKNLLDEIDEEITIETSEQNNLLVDRVVILKESYRSEKNIQKIAAMIINQEKEKLTDLKFLSSISQIHLNLSADYLKHIKNNNVSSTVNKEFSKNNDNFQNIFENSGCFWIKNQDYPPEILKKLLFSWLDYNYIKHDLSGISFVELVKKSKNIDFDNINQPVTKELFKKLFILLERARILTFIRKTIYGAETINKIAIDYLKTKFSGSSSKQIFTGLPILITKNDYDKKLFNGDVGLIIQSKNRVLRAFFARRNEFISFPLDTIPSFKPAYAMTVHKSQGSEYDSILLILPPDTEHRMLNQQIIYTGLTRARTKAIIYAPEKSLLKAVKHRIYRDSGINIWQ